MKIDMSKPATREIYVNIASGGDESSPGFIYRARLFVSDRISQRASVIFWAEKGKTDSIHPNVFGAVDVSTE